MICNLYPEPLYFFFSPDVPSLLYYTHIPSIIIALLVGFFVFWHGRQFLLNKLLLGISIFFSIWTIIALITWTNIHSEIILFFWSLLGLCSSFIAILSVYFIYVFLEKKDVSLYIKGIFLLLLTPIFLISSTSLNLGGFNLTECDAFKFENIYFQTYYTLLGILAIVWILFLLIRHYRISLPDFRKQIILIGVGIESFLFTFFIFVFVVSYLTQIGILSDSRLEMFGLLGMTFFIGFLAFLIVRFHTFNIKLIGAQALMWTIGLLVGSLIILSETTAYTIISSVTLLIVIGAGILLVRSVKKVDEQRELLEIANNNQQSLIHFITHQLKGFFTKSKMIFAGLVEEDFGQTSPEIKDVAKQGLVSDDKAVEMIQNILGASNLKSGTTAFNLNKVDLSKTVKDIASSFTSAVTNKGLKYEVNIPDGPIMSLVDETQITQVFKNLIDNSLHYTQTGEIKVSLKINQGNKILFTIEDTGVGLSDSDKNKLFTEGGKGDDSLKVNTDSTGYGLYIVKKIVDSHYGRIWAESAGRGKGSQFYVELDLAK